ncbi:MAG: phytanoyl-CoA dioxygenase family protein [Planctomycetota bacterium]|nr:phytanoyl-CoA dioxygenase family protein [Planctomycetota bacterium]
MPAAAAIDFDRTVALSDEQIRFYQKHGYIQIHDVLTPEEVEFTRESIAEAIEYLARTQQGKHKGNPFYSKVFHQEVNLWRIHEGVKRYTLSRRIGELARQLTGVSKMRLWHDHCLYKMPGGSLASDWHQDWPYWPMYHTGAMSCWMALDDVDEVNGCLQFVPGSYQWGIYPAISLGSGKKQLEKMLTEEETAKFKPVTMPMKAGSCTFHDGLCFHYATPNRSEKPRRAFATIFQPDGTQFRKKGHCVTDPLNLNDGDVLAGELFSVVAEGAPFETSTFHDARARLKSEALLNDARHARMNRE